MLITSSYLHNNSDILGLSLLLLRIHSFDPSIMRRYSVSMVTTSSSPFSSCPHTPVRYTGLSKVKAIHLLWSIHSPTVSVLRSDAHAFMRCVWSVYYPPTLSQTQCLWHKDTLSTAQVRVRACGATTRERTKNLLNTVRQNTCPCSPCFMK